MDSEIEYDAKITLKISWKEALWLKHLVQNSHSLREDEEESAETYEMRMKYWEVLKKVPNSIES